MRFAALRTFFLTFPDEMSHTSASAGAVCSRKELPRLAGQLLVQVANHLSITGVESLRRPVFRLR